MAERVHWERATAVSGTLESASAIVVLAYWYMQAMTRMINAGVDSAMHGKFGGQEVTEHQVAGAALFVFATHPFTWMLAYAIVEGAVRLSSALFTEVPLGIFPLYVLRRAVMLAAHPREESPMEDIRRNVASIAEAAREQLMVARLKKVPDELQYSREAEEEVLVIRASRRKVDWVAPKVVRVDEVFYRLDESSVEKGARPFRYRLTRLAAGVPGRSVILYKSAGTIVKE